MDESRGLQSVSGSLSGHLDGGEAAKLLIHQRKQVLSGASISLLGAFENAGDFAHARQISQAAVKNSANLTAPSSVLFHAMETLCRGKGRRVGELDAVGGGGLRGQVGPVVGQRVG